MIWNFIDDVCGQLKIDVPVVSFETSHFPTKTTMALCSQDSSTIYLKKSRRATPDYLFAIAHELRHIWQIRNDYDLYFSKYRPADQCASLEEYNLQAAELDANAFAWLVMEDSFHLTPLFHGVPESVKSKISERMEQLKGAT